MSVCVDREKQLKFYRDWLARVKTVGVRDPTDPFRTLSVDHPLAQKKIKELETHIAFHEGKITLDEYDKKLVHIETGSNPRMLLGSQSSVWEHLREFGMGLEQLDAYATHEAGGDIVIELKWKKHLLPSVKSRTISALRQEGYKVRSSP